LRKCGSATPSRQLGTCGRGRYQVTHKWGGQTASPALVTHSPG
jgi:hypothetical protein